MIFKGKIENHIKSIVMTRITMISSACIAVATTLATLCSSHTLSSSWSCLPTGDAIASVWDDTRAIERCALDELHIRFDINVLASSLFTDHNAYRQALRSGRHPVRLDIVRVATDAADEVVQTAQVPCSIEVPPTQDDGKLEAPPPPIECALDTTFCVPKIVGIRLPELVGEDQTLSVNHSIVIQFAEPTNQPDVATQDDVFQFVSFKTYVGDEMEGTWEDAKTLVLRVTRLDEAKVPTRPELMAALVHTTLLVQETTDLDSDGTAAIQGDVVLRIEPEGEFVLHLKAGEDQILAQSPVVRVKACQQTNTILVLKNQPLDHRRQRAELPSPKVFIDGMLTHDGKSGYTLRHTRIAMKDRGSWSLNFWLFLSQDATGSFRTLFFNGDGNGQHRTPSAWLRPHDRRLVLRVSTVSNMDVGLDSNKELPTNKWVNIGLTFRNCSTGGDANATVRPECKPATTNEESTKPWFYSFKLIVDGEPDQEVRIFSPVLPNEGPLQLGKSPWADGFAGFTSQLRVFDVPVNDTVHAEISRQDRYDLYRRFMTHDECETVTRRSRATKIPPSVQISYLTQCVSAMEADPSGLVTMEFQKTGGGDAVYEEYTRALSRCDHSGWDLLVEAAELGHTRALRDIGSAMLYGRIPFVAECAKTKHDGIKVDMDHERAYAALLAAMKERQWDASRSLALLLRVNEDSGDNSLSMLRPFQLGLYHLAAMSGYNEAFVILGRLYATGQGELIQVNSDVAAYHYSHAASAASIAYHARGKQPLHEMNRLYDGIHSEDDLRKGQLGDDDELIQYQKMRADKDGDVDAMFNMGDLYYWGARGLPREHERAYQYFHNAAQRGHTGAQSAVAGMLLKGEGTQQNNESAIEWYEKAAMKNHTRALNGLGFIHFYGSGGMVENKTLALQYFERAAANLEDGDSVFNAGYCHAFGLGTEANITRAMEYYATAARKFGHFDAIYELGKIYYTGYDYKDSNSTAEIPQDSDLAITYFKAASDAGSWGASVRTGFELFLAGEFERAAMAYHEANEYGYPVATSNLAYIYDQKLLREGHKPTETKALTYLMKASEQNGDKEVLVRIGDYHFYGLAGLARSSRQALKWYSKASAEGVEAGAYNVGHMHEYGLGVPVNYDRARRYYERVLELAPASAIDRHVAGHLALLRLRLRAWTKDLGLSDQGARQVSTEDLNDFSEVHVARLVVLSSVAVAVAIGMVGVWFIWKQRAPSA